jgi:hypothetical protein
MLNFTPNWILDKCNILQYFPYPHIVFRLNRIPQWIPLKSINARAGSDRICLKQKIPQKVFQSCPIIPTSWRQNILSHKICPGVNTQFDVKKMECGLYERSRVATRLIIGIFTLKKNNCANFKVFNCFDRIINNLLYCILKVLVETFQNYSSFRSTLFSGISDFNKSPKSCKFWSQGSS